MYAAVVVEAELSLLRESAPVAWPAVYHDCFSLGTKTQSFFQAVFSEIQCRLLSLFP